MFIFFFFFKQKTAYEMRISDWSSDVCSSDLRRLLDYATLVEQRRLSAARGAGLLARCRTAHFARPDARHRPILRWRGGSRRAPQRAAVRNRDAGRRR